jgi:hypothetical protein
VLSTERVGIQDMRDLDYTALKKILEILGGPMLLCRCTMQYLSPTGMVENHRFQEIKKISQCMIFRALELFSTLP